MDSEPQELIVRIDELAGLMEEFGLAEAKLQGEDWRIAFRRRRTVQPVATVTPVADAAELLIDEELEVLAEAPRPAVPVGLPVSSPMTGIFYTSPSPNAPPFVRPGDSVTAGQVVGLIEAMKVFNEIVAPTSGTVDRIVAESGALVSPGEPLLYIS